MHSSRRTELRLTIFVKIFRPDPAVGAHSTSAITHLQIICKIYRVLGMVRNMFILLPAAIS